MKFAHATFVGAGTAAFALAAAVALFWQIGAPGNAGAASDSTVCPTTSGSAPPAVSGPLTISAPGLYNGNGQIIRGGGNNIDIEASNVTVCNYVLQSAQEAAVKIGAFSNITLSSLDVEDYNHSGAGGNTPGGPQYAGGVACWYCTSLTVVNSTFASTKDYGDGIWVKRTNAAEAGPDYLAGNTIIGGWDGIGSEPEGDPDGGFGTGTIIENNVVSSCHDDGIQVEGRDENITVRNNTITGCGTGVATAAALIGPVHIENNYIHDLVLAPSTAFFCFKLGASQGTNTPEIDYTGNTCISPGAGGFEQTNSGLNFKIVATHNCIQDGLYVIEFNEQPGRGTLFDYNTLYTTDATGRFAKWAGQRYNLAGLRSLGQELHGAEAQGCPRPGQPSATPSAIPTVSVTATRTPSGTATPTPSVTATPTPSATATAAPTPSATAIPTPTVTATPSATATPSRTPNPPQAPTAAPKSSTPSPTPRRTLTHTVRPTKTPSATIPADTLVRGPISGAPARLSGDVDCDGRVTTADAVRLLANLAGIRDSSACTPIVDVNCDGTVTAADALAIVLYVLRPDRPLPAGCPLDVAMRP